MLVPIAVLAGRGLGAPCSPVLTADQIYTVARQAGFPASTAVQMTAIALRESGGCPSAHYQGNPVGAEDSYGLWQINVQGNPGILTQLGIQATDLYDPATNAAAAFLLWGGNDNNLNVAWSIGRGGYYTSQYQANLPAAQAAADAVEPTLSGSSAPSVASSASSGTSGSGFDLGSLGLVAGVTGLFLLFLDALA